MTFTWDPIEGWMSFSCLDGNVYSDKSFTIAWRFRDQPREKWTSRINSFKVGNPQCVLSAGQMLKVALPPLIERIGLDPRETGLSVALSHGDVATNPEKPLGVCGKYICLELGLQWVPGLLSKRPHRALHTLHSAEARTNELEGIYTASDEANNFSNIIILDDIITRGDTISRIAEAIKGQNSNVTVIGIALGKAESLGYAQQNSYNLNNNHVPVDWDEIWTRNLT